MKRINDTRQTYLRLLLYGAPGSTKTRTAATAALDERTSPVLWLDSGGNPTSFRTYEKQPDIFLIEELTDLNDPYNWLAHGQQTTGEAFGKFYMDNFPNTPPKDFVPYKTVVIDGITDVQRTAFNHVMSFHGGPGDVPRKREWDHFNKVLQTMINLADLFLKLDMHVILTALEKRTEDRMTGSLLYGPLLDGQSDQEVPGKALAVGRMIHTARMTAMQKKDVSTPEQKAKDSIAAVFFKPTAQYHAKDQYGMNEDFILDPTIGKILDLIEAGPKPNPVPTKTKETKT